MKKNDYINYIESIQPEQGLKNRLKNKVLKHNKTKRNYIYFGVAAAACVLVMACILPQILNAPVQENLPPVAINSPVQTQIESPIPTQELPEAYSQRLCSFAVQMDDWIYYSNHEDEDKLYKIKEDGTGKTKLNDKITANINIIDDWIYYTIGYKNYGENKNLAEICKMNIEGNQEIIIKEIEGYKTSSSGWAIGNLELRDFFVDNQNIYCTILGSDEKKNTFFKTYKIKLDGSDEELFRNENISSMKIVDDSMYYVDFNDFSRLYKMQNDKKIRLTDKYFINSKYIIDGDWIYYSGSLFYDKQTNEQIDDPVKVLEQGGLYTNEIRYLCRVRLDGSDEQKLDESSAADYVVVCPFYINDGWIYYTNISDEGHFYKMRTDGSEKQKIANEYISIEGIVDGWIYFISLESGDMDNSHLFKMRIDGTEKQRVEIFETQKIETSPAS